MDTCTGDGSLDLCACMFYVLVSWNSSLLEFFYFIIPQKVGGTTASHDM